MFDMSNRDSNDNKIEKQEWQMVMLRNMQGKVKDVKSTAMYWISKRACIPVHKSSWFLEKDLARGYAIFSGFLIADLCLVTYVCRGAAYQVMPTSDLIMETRL